MYKLLKVTSFDSLALTHMYTQTCRRSFQYQIAPETITFHFSCTCFFFLEDDPLLLLVAVLVDVLPPPHQLPKKGHLRSQEEGKKQKNNNTLAVYISKMAVFGSVRATWYSVM